MLIAGTQSGCGKTTITLALMQYLSGQGISVSPFKAGPDFLDPMWHAAVCEQTSYNLDTRMLGEDACRALFHEKAVHNCLIEGVMGLFDGASGVGSEGSSVHLAKTLNEPVLLAVNAKGMSGSIVPLIEGFNARANAMGVRITGIIANHVGSANHARILRELTVEFDLPPLVAWMEQGAPSLPERYLGLVTPAKDSVPDFSPFFHVEEDIFFAVIQKRSTVTAAESNTVSRRLHGKTVAIAWDAAFCFVYPANLEWLEDEGAELLFFSPLAGEAVAGHAAALWLPGGYPELYARALSESASWSSISSFIEADKPVLAECGGMMVLGESICDQSAQRWPVAGTLPCSFVMQDKLAGLGYREEASGVLGHEFHHSRREDITTGAQRGNALQPAFEVSRGDAGLRYKNLRASYIHWYFPSQPDVVASWLGGSHGH